MSWQPIETAPKATDDHGIGPTVLLYVPEGHGLDAPAVTIGSYFREQVRDEDGRFLGGEWTAIDWDYCRTPYVKPSHWQPLPAPPEEPTPSTASLSQNGEGNLGSNVSKRQAGG